mgnify:CR=1 FL=1
MGVKVTAEEITQQEQNDEVLLGEAVKARAPLAPFVLYGLTWVIFAVVTIVLLGDVPSGSTVVAQAEYPGVLAAALALAIAGPLLALIVWGLTWYRASAARGGSIFSSAMLRAAVALAVGVAAWWAALTYVDMIRL